MNRFSALALVIGTALVSTTLGSGQAVADDDANASALVHLTTLKQGSLPIVVTAYGEVRPSADAQESIAAPVAVRVAAVPVRVGEEVAKGTPMITLIPSPETRAAYKQAQLALHLANQLAQRSAELVKSHLQTATDLAQNQKAAAEAKSQLAVLEEEGAAGPNTIKAPYDAIILKVDAGPGSVVAQGVPMIEIARPNGLVLKAGVVPAQAVSITVGNEVSITPLGSDESYPGKVLLRGAVVNAGDGLVPVEIAVPPGKFLTGEMAEAAITTGEKHGYVVPHEALLVNDQGDSYVVQAVKMAAKKVPVHILGTQGDKDLIEGHLDPAAPLVLAGNYQLDDGTKLRVAEAAGDASKQKGGK